MTKKELLAIVRFTRQYLHYFLGTKFYVRTDHGGLACLMKFKLISSTFTKWLEQQSQYDIVILHRKGTQHCNEYALSRIPDDLSFCNCYKAG